MKREEIFVLFIHAATGLKLELLEQTYLRDFYDNAPKYVTNCNFNFTEIVKIYKIIFFK